MTPPISDSSAALTKLVSFLATQRESILKNWRIACNQDPLLKNVTNLSQVDFDSGLPLVLTILQQRLVGQPEEGIIAKIATTHGLQRRRKAHGIIEVVQELNHLTQALYNELSHFQESFPLTDPKLFWSVQQHMTQIMAEVIKGNITLYDQLQRSEAAERADVLQQALNQLSSLSQDRRDRLRSSMHDLRGGLGIIGGAVTLLQLEGLSEPERTDYLDLLSRNLTSVHAMLANLTDLSRLEAGAETLQIQPLDAAPLLKEIASSVQPMAQKRGLVVRTQGPDSLRIETDAVKLQRMIQNLLLNAVKYTSTGFIDISWAKQDSNQWRFQIQDPGPGLPARIVRQLTDHLKSASNPVDRGELEQLASAPFVPEATDEPVAELAAEPSANDPNKGEGIGLTIVKEFSQLLGATLAVEVAPGQGTCFQFWLPIRYQD